MITNPLKAARLASSLSQRQLAEHTGLSPQSVLRAEQGLFSSPPKTVLEFLEVSDAAYFKWVYEQRAYNGRSDITDTALARHDQLGMTSTDRLRSECFQLSVAGFAKHLVVQISIMQEFLNKHRNTETIGGILLQWGFDMTQLTDFKEWIDAA